MDVARCRCHEQPLTGRSLNGVGQACRVVEPPGVRVAGVGARDEFTRDRLRSVRCGGLGSARHTVAAVCDDLGMSNPAAALYPEVAAGGFSRVDGGVEFYQRVNALATQDSVVVDIGAGRGSLTEDTVQYRRQLRSLRGSVRRLIALDVDPVVLTNPTVDEAHVIDDGGRFPLDDRSVDLAVSDWTFEHVVDSGMFCAEIDRVLRPGGWICARTPNKWGYIGIGARAVPNRFHNAGLSRLQPWKKEIDTFDVAYRLNTRRQLQFYFPTACYDHFVYTMNNEPAYFATSLVASRIAKGIFRLLPESLGATFYVFLRKHED
jgi:SAM-dependent methyltransferase